MGLGGGLRDGGRGAGRGREKDKRRRLLVQARQDAGGAVIEFVAPPAGRIAAAASLAVLYGATAGGMATPAGILYNPLTLALMERLTGYGVTFAQWTSIVVIVLSIVLVPTLQAFTIP